LTGDLDTVRELLQEDNRLLAEQVVDRNPWLCEKIGVDLSVWAAPIVADFGLESGSFHIIGSAAFGFSIKSETPGRPFRRKGGGKRPSDLDVAVVHADFFDECWSAMVGFDRASRITSRKVARQGVYWGHIDDFDVPKRSALRRRLLELANSIRRSREFQGYPCNIRMYRSREDLVGYVTNSLNELERIVPE